MHAVIQEQLAENPLVEGLERLPVHPTTLVIFGGTGDLAKRKLLPAVYNLAHEGALPERFNLIQFSRREPDEEVLSRLLERMRYVPGTFDDDSVYETLGRELGQFDEEAGIAF